MLFLVRHYTWSHHAHHYASKQITNMHVISVYFTRYACTPLHIILTKQITHNSGVYLHYHPSHTTWHFASPYYTKAIDRASCYRLNCANICYKIQKHTRFFVYYHPLFGVIFHLTDRCSAKLHRLNVPV